MSAANRSAVAALTVAVVFTLFAGAPGAATATQSGSGAGSGVCSGVTRCHVRAHADVNGDGRVDSVGVASRGHGANREVIVRVRTAPDQISTARQKAPNWLGSLWHGVARLDGRRGVEIVVGETEGLHAHLYRAMTWRHGDLTTLRAPGHDRYWYTDGAYSIGAGWQVRAGTAPGTIRRRVAIRVSPTRARPFRGHVNTFHWDSGDWVRVSTKKVPEMRQRRAYSWGGFYVPGLPRWS